MKLIYPKIELYESPTKLEYIEKEIPVVLEEIGRVCYKSEGLAKPGSAEKFLQARIQEGHLSILRHETLRVKIHCSRAASHQFVRHGLANFTQESMRFVNYLKESQGSNVVFIIPHWVKNITPRNLEDIHTLNLPEAECSWLNMLHNSEDYYFWQLNAGLKPEDARGGLPHDAKTELIITANLEEWRNIFKARCTKHAQIEIRTLMLSALYKFSLLLPSIFGDLTYLLED
jgi:thymidylate synthase (FAD)